jgi:hypothetical protein
MFNNDKHKFCILLLINGMQQSQSYVVQQPAADVSTQEPVANIVEQSDTQE